MEFYLLDLRERGKARRGFGEFTFFIVTGVFYLSKETHALLHILTITLMLDFLKQLWRLVSSEVIVRTHNLLGYEEM